MKLHLYWRDKNWERKGAADNYNLFVDMENKTYKIWVNSFYGYDSVSSIEVKRKSDIDEYVAYLKAHNFISETRFETAEIENKVLEGENTKKVICFL